jgi:uncharacterized caspase-like protein
MAKLALLIGVGEYQTGLTSLPSAIRDVAAMQQLLQHPQIGGFDQVLTLLNPVSQEMREAIESLFSDRKKDDLTLLFFSGHGIKDDQGKLYFATRSTRKKPDGDLMRATAVSASSVQDAMSHSRSRRQIIILDCCFSGAFAEGMTAKDDGSVDIQSQLGGEGRAVMTSSTSTQYSFEQQGSASSSSALSSSALSIYTSYLIEGIETGAADVDNDGLISVDELHEYVRKKVQEAAPAMKPKLYATEEGFKIRLAQAPTTDPKLIYRKAIEPFASRGQISDIGRETLEVIQKNLKLSSEVAAAIEAEVLQPYRIYQDNLQQYTQVLAKAIRKQYPLSEVTQRELRSLQAALGLRDEDVRVIEAQLTPIRFQFPSRFWQRSPKLYVMAIVVLGVVLMLIKLTSDWRSKGSFSTATLTIPQTVSPVSSPSPTPNPSPISGSSAVPSSSPVLSPIPTPVGILVPTPVPDHKPSTPTPAPTSNPTSIPNRKQPVQLVPTSNREGKIHGYAVGAEEVVDASYLINLQAGQRLNVNIEFGAVKFDICPRIENPGPCIVLNMSEPLDEEIPRTGQYRLSVLSTEPTHFILTVQLNGVTYVPAP